MTPKARRAYSGEFPTTPDGQRRLRIEIDRIPADLYERIRVAARREGVSLRTLTLRLLSEWEANHRPPTRRRVP